MKRVWISAIIFIILLTVCIWGETTTKNASSTMIETITSAKLAAVDGNNELAYRLSKKAVSDWKNYHKILCTYMPHSQLEAIDQTLSGMPMLCYYGTRDQFTSECEKSITQLNYLNESQQLSIANIF
jgi:predicted phosphoadenosine phosphosulfate sulfurtransferase